MKVLIIGRDAACDIVIYDPKVSRNHCQLVLKDDGSCLIVDLGSSNGTYVNGQRISGEVRLSSLDSVRIGDTVLPLQQYVPSVQRVQEPVQDPIHGKKKSWIWVAAGLVSILLVGGGVVLFRPHEEKIYQPDPGDKDRIENLLQLRIKADSLTKAALFAKTEEDRIRFQEKAQKIDRLIKEKEALEKDKKALEENRNQLERDITGLEETQKQLERDKTGLEETQKQLKDTTKVLKDANKNLAVEAKLTNEFMTLWSSPLAKKTDFQRDVFNQCTQRPYPENSEEDPVVEAFKNADNDGKQKMLDIINVTKDFYPQWEALNDKKAEKVFASMDWKKESSPKAKDQLKQKFKTSEMTEKHKVVSAIKEILSKDKDDAAKEKETTSDTKDKVDSVKMEESTSETSVPKSEEVAGLEQSEK